MFKSPVLERANFALFGHWLRRAVQEYESYQDYELLLQEIGVQIALLLGVIVA